MESSVGTSRASAGGMPVPRQAAAVTARDLHRVLHQTASLARPAAPRVAVQPSVSGLAFVLTSAGTTDDDGAAVSLGLYCTRKATIHKQFQARP